MKNNFPGALSLLLVILCLCFQTAEAQDSVAVQGALTETVDVNCDSLSQVSIDTEWIRKDSAVIVPVIPVNRHYHGQWLFIFFLIQLGIIAYIKAAYAKSLDDLFRGCLNMNISQQLSREQEVSMPFSAFLLNLNFVMSVGVFFYLILEYYHLKGTAFSFQLFIFIQCFVLFVFSMKYGFLKLTGIIFPFKEELDYFNFNFFIDLKLMGIFLLPLNLFIAYSPGPFDNFAVVLSCILLGLFATATIYRGFQYGRNHFRMNKVHFFLYICTLEIAPYIILVKVISEWLH